MLVLALAKLVTFHEDPCQLYLISLYLKMSELQNRAFAWNADAHTLAPGFKGWGEKPCSFLTLWSSAWHLSGSSSLRDFKLTLVPLGFVLRTRQEFFFFFPESFQTQLFQLFLGSWAIKKKIMKKSPHEFLLSAAVCVSRSLSLALPDHILWPWETALALFSAYLSSVPGSPSRTHLPRRAEAIWEKPGWI